MMTLQTLTSILFLSSVTLSLPAQAQGKAHAHGAVALNIAIEAQSIKIEMTSPLDNLVGFERAPRTAQERQRVAGMAAQLRSADKLFQLPPSATCQLTNVELSAPVVGLNADGAQPSPSAADSGHSDLDAVFAFTCAQAAQATHLDIGLFSAFKGIQRVDVQLVSPKGQRQQTLRRPAQRLKLE
jgi:Protein of unknown function (DUF2796)